MHVFTTLCILRVLNHFLIKTFLQLLDKLHILSSLTYELGEQKALFLQQIRFFFEKKVTQNKKEYSVVRRCFSKTMFLKISQHPQKNTYVRVLESLFNKVADLQLCSFIKKRLPHCFFLHFFIEHLLWLARSAESHNRLSLFLSFTCFL